MTNAHFMSVNKSWLTKAYCVIVSVLISQYGKTAMLKQSGALLDFYSTNVSSDA